MTRRTPKHVVTVDEFVALMGGVSEAAAALTARCRQGTITRQNVWNCKSRGHLSPTWYFLAEPLLAEKGREPSPKLFGMREPKK